MRPNRPTNDPGPLETLRKHFTSPKYRPQTFEEICTAFRARGSDKQKIRRSLEELRHRGEIVCLRNHRYVPVEVPEQVTGRLQTNPRGFGFLIPDDGSEDVFIPGQALEGARHGDRVTVEKFPGRGQGRFEGRVRDVLERGIHVVVGRLGMSEGKRFYVAPFGREIPHPVALEGKLPAGLNLHEGEIVAVTLDWKRSGAERLVGQLKAILGKEQDEAIDSKIVIHRHDLPLSFPAEVSAEAEAVQVPIRRASIGARQDLTHLPFVTIDGADARDHDDAVALEKPGVLWVAIADVSSYVAAGGVLDAEAISRGNSYYFPDLVVPMLPERLSNNLCSLRPKEERLAVAARLTLSPEGRLESTQLSEAIIRSRARLTYEGVDRALSAEGDPMVPAEVLPMLREMKKVSNTVFETRLKEGGIDFDLSEAKVILDEHGDVAQMARRERTPSQRIIEECMLLANKGVAQLLGSAGYPLIYRVHDKPDPKKVAEFFGLIRSQGFTVKLKPGEASHKQIDGILSRFEGETRGRVFSYIAMRTMSRAYYSTQNIGHYGLGFPDYVHFTSPIRRYADLVIHRLIKIFIAKQKTVEGELVPETYGTLENAAVQISARERVAQTAEREIRTIKGIRFLSARKGETFKGMIVGVIKQGFFVELDDHAVEGFVPLLRLPKDRYEFLEVQLALKGQQRGKTYRIGDSVSIRVENADLATFQIEFSVTR